MPGLFERRKENDAKRVKPALGAVYLSAWGPHAAAVDEGLRGDAAHPAP